jgi:hypothetical protein
MSASQKDILEPLWHLAQAACKDIEEFQPDLVIALAHSGWLPLRAVLTLWEETHRQPFPPFMLTNIGREKGERYFDFTELLDLPMFQGVYAPTEVIVGWLAWLYEQRQMHDTLRQQIAGVLGPDVGPQRVLVVDDFVHEGSTWITTLGLLWLVFPTADSRFVSSAPQLPKAALGMLWVQQEHPEVFEALRGRIEAEEKSDPARSSDLEFYLGDVACGTEDVTRYSLEWRRISASSKCVQVLSDFLPAEQWLKMPMWVQNYVETYIRKQAHRPPSSWPPCPPYRIHRQTKRDMQKRANPDYDESHFIGE